MRIWLGFRMGVMIKFRYENRGRVSGHGLDLVSRRGSELGSGSGFRVGVRVAIGMRVGLGAGTGVGVGFWDKLSFRVGVGFRNGVWGRILESGSASCFMMRVG
ncbi:hypothetical protein TIFTF001_012250 [Ficus carica]|uniref:Uncharacterized protein n=1 Tax=Ficus carica TaxID=3494 RepID=A0AA88D3J0_FICCA|nr:hypothetical protein TIFTF001_012250 [Ficus carica]